MKIAVPLEGELVAEHFGHAPLFAIYEIDVEGVRKEILTPPPHEPGVIPRWLASLGVNCILCGMMGLRAATYFEEYGIKVVSGVPPAPADEVVAEFWAGRLKVSPQFCHHGGQAGGCGHGGGGCRH